MPLLSTGGRINREAGIGMTILKQIGILFLTASGGFSAPGTLPLPVEAGKNLDRALELTALAHRISAEEHLGIQNRKTGEAASQLAAALERLAAQLPAKTCALARKFEGEDIESKLTAIACDKRSRPAVHAEIERVYVKGVHAKESRFPRSPELEDTHATESYRPAWEYFLLSPEPEGASPLYHVRAGEALGRIRNNASIVALRYSCQAASQKGVDPDTAEDRQLLALRTLNLFANEQALRAILECVRHIRQQRESSPVKDRWDAEGYVYRLLADLENCGNGLQWRKVLTSFPREGLSPEHRKLLEDALKALERSRSQPR